MACLWELCIKEVQRSCPLFYCKKKLYPSKFIPLESEKPMRYVFCRLIALLYVNMCKLRACVECALYLFVVYVHLAYSVSNIV